MPLLGLSARADLSYEGRFTPRDRRARPSPDKRMEAEARSEAELRPVTTPVQKTASFAPPAVGAIERQGSRIDRGADALAGLSLLALLSNLMAAVRAGNLDQARRAADLLDGGARHPAPESAEFAPHFAELRQMLGMTSTGEARANDAAAAGAAYQAATDYSADRNAEELEQPGFPAWPT